MDLQPLSPHNQDSFSYKEKHTHYHDIAERFILGFGSFLVSILGIRFILSLLGANPSNGFANLIYSFTSPFVSPFVTLFSYDHPSLGISTFEGYTIVAMIVYGLVTIGAARLVTITRY